MPDSSSAATAPSSWEGRVRLDPMRSVNDVLLQHPETLAVFNAFGVDACCGGAASLTNAARDAGLEPLVLLEALESVIRADPEPAR